MVNTGSLIITNAQILAGDWRQPQARAILISDGRIKAIGSVADVEANSSEVEDIIDAQGATIVPGFIDTHVHFTLTGLGLLAVNLQGVGTIETVLTKLSEAANNYPDDWLVVALNFQPELIAESRFPTAQEISQATFGRPGYVMEEGGHWSAVNQEALELLNLSEAVTGVQVDEEGNFTGLLSGQANTEAFTKLWQHYGAQVGLERAFDRAAAEAVRGGITTLHALDDLEDVRSLLDYQDRLPVRIVPYCQTKDVAAVEALGLSQIGGCGQVMVDGDFGPHTASLLEPYSDDPLSRGTLYYTDDELSEFVAEAHDAGLQVALHSIGSGAIEQLLNAYEQSLARRSRVDHRHRIEHFQLPGPGQIDRAKRLGIALAMQPAFNHFWPHHTGYPDILGKERSLRLDPLRSVLDAGLQVAYGSDSPVTPLRPLLWMHSAVNHSNPAERIAVETALHLSTAAGGWLAFEEDDKGTLEPGKLGDLVLLSDNPLTVASEALKDIQVLMTIIDGTVVCEA